MYTQKQIAKEIAALESIRQQRDMNEYEIEQLEFWYEMADECDE